MGTGRGRTHTLFPKCAANRCNDFMFCPECANEMGEVLNYITRVILFVSAVDMIPLSVSQCFERRIGITVKSIRAKREKRKKKERKM